MRVKVEITTGLEEYLPKREYAKVSRAAWRKIGETWQAKHRPRHFTLYGHRLYGYTSRKPWYNKHKRTGKRQGKKLQGIALPLVYSGTSRKLSEEETIRVNKKSGQYAVTISSPIRVFNFRPKNSSVNMRQEYQAKSADEIAMYEKILWKALTQAIARKPRRRRRKRIR